MSFTTKTWSCSAFGCENKAFVAGMAKGLIFLGWSVSDDERHLFCPLHHPGGPEFVQACLNGGELFMRISMRLDPANPGFDPSIIIDLYNMAGYPMGIVLPPERAD